MEKTKLRIDLLPNQFLKTDGTFDLDEALKLSGKIAGVCYDKEGFEHLKDEPFEKTQRRIYMTINNGHHSVYDHIWISFNLQNVPKILAMILNNEKEYTTSEKSARYTPIVRTSGSVITGKEEHNYKKWTDIFKKVIDEEYRGQFNDSKVTKLAQENARYMVTVFMPTEMIYSTSLRQINYIASWMIKYMKEHELNKNDFEDKLIDAMYEFVKELDRVNVLRSGLMNNEKQRSLSLFGKDLSERQNFYGDLYQTTYKASFAEVAQAQRHRTIDYQIELLENKEFYVPPILKKYPILEAEWLSDITELKDINPVGELVYVLESAKYEDFILKCKERLCSAAQLEIMQQTRDTLLKYKEVASGRIYEDLLKHDKGARCTFPDYKCPLDCGFKEGKTLTRKI